MPAVVYVQPDGTEKVANADLGLSVMQTALNEGIDGIVAECGGALVCATCHVYVDEQFRALLPPIGPMEDALLDGVASERREGSRLSCQLILSEALDGLRVELPEAQL
jgi:2Fe-2S ferredoxin